MRKGHRVARSSVAQILKNPFYMGDFLWNGAPIIRQMFEQYATGKCGARQESTGILEYLRLWCDVSMRICEENYSGCPVPGNRRFKENRDS